MIQEALEFACRAHAGQTRKGSKVPYLTHPVAVSRSLMEVGCGEDLAVAALLHDLVEDTAVSEADLRQRFGERVADLVREASEPDKSLPWEERKRHTLEQLAHEQDEEVLLLVLADKLDNLSQLRRDLQLEGEKVWSRFSRGHSQQKWLFDGLVEVFRKRLPGHPLLAWFEQEHRLVFS